MRELYRCLPEKNRRLYAGVEGLKLPYGGSGLRKIEKTATKAGLKVFVCIFNRIYKTGRKVAAGFKESMRIVFDKYLG
jgi:hypothetical protein